MAAEASLRRTKTNLYALPGTLLQEPGDQSPTYSCRKVRILDLDPVLDHQCEARTPIAGTLRVVDLDDKPEFAALSYCRTQAIGKRCRHFDARLFLRPTVRCNVHHVVEVDANRLDALWHLRKA